MPYRRLGFWHGGVDIGGLKGTPIYATHDGIVTMGNDLAKTIHIKDPTNTVMTVYSHSDPTVSNGQKVKAGDVIGYISDNGTTPGTYHLHYEIQLRESAESDQGLKLNYRSMTEYKSFTQEAGDPGSIFRAEGWYTINPLNDKSLEIIPGTAPFDPSKMANPQRIIAAHESFRHPTQGVRNILNRNSILNNLFQTIFGK